MSEKVTVTFTTDSREAQLLIALHAALVGYEDLEADISLRLLPDALGLIADTLSEYKESDLDGWEWNERQIGFMKHFMRIEE